MMQRKLIALAIASLSVPVAMSKPVRDPVRRNTKADEKRMRRLLASHKGRK